jgi:3-deoxy-manno-octulosonate cytidylyltransferase (CMP-KDO synthetase)
MLKFIGIIPARFASTRFPGKPLIDIKGKSMIQRVFEQASQAGLDAVYVATDHQKIYDRVIDFGGQCLLTAENHQSGTDRCNECAIQLKLDDNSVLINIQGDEPFIQPTQINLLCNLFNDSTTSIATLIKKIDTLEELEKNTIPKVVVNTNGFAIYFSRNIIPFPAKKTVEALLHEGIYYKHIGIYAYRVGTLKKIATLKPSFLEQTESLEQLRWIENAYPIKTAITMEETIAIDTRADLEKALIYIEQNNL